VYPAQDFSFWVYFLRDFTEQERLQQQLLQSQKLEAIGTLAGGMAHEFNNLLMAISAHSSMMEMAFDRKEGEDAYKKRTQKIQESVQRAASLTKGLLSFARSHEGEKAVFDIKSLIKEIVSLSRQTFDRSIEIRSAVPRDLWPIAGDIHQLYQLVLNLCLNARDAMPEGGVLSIEAKNLDGSLDEEVPLDRLQGGKFVHVRISDTGVGMTPETKRRIFDPFFTTKEVGKGTGLGLAVVYGIVQSHGGFIDVSSEVNKGTRFDVFFPAALQDLPGTALTGQAESGKGTILVIEDEKDIQEGLRDMLTYIGYDVLDAGDGEEGWHLYQEHEGRIDLVLLDVMLPRLNGAEVLRRIRRLNKQMPVLILTGHLEGGIEEQVSAMKPNAILKKPCNFSELSQIIAKTLRGGDSEA
jgi:nitrogen-specific signal transduction histidine kinase/ActR/RegA family two-component response regulator